MDYPPESLNGIDPQLIFWLVTITLGIVASVMVDGVRTWRTSRRKARALRENRAGIERAKADADAIEMANEMRKGRE